MASQDDPKSRLEEALKALREAQRALRDGVVQAVARRNTLQDMVDKLDARLAELLDKARAADELAKPDIATELRAEHERSAAERVKLQGELAVADSAAAAAKDGLPAAEQRLLEQARDLRARFGEIVSQHIGADPADDPTSAWSRATDKLRSMQSEVQARAEAAGAPPPPAVSPEETAEKQIAELEARLGMAQAAPAAAGQNEAPDVPAAPSGAPDGTAALPRFDVSINPRHERRSEPMDPTQRVRIAAIGTGNIFRGAHLPAYPDIAAGRLVALCDPDKAAQEATLTRYRAIVDEKAQQMRDRGDTAGADRIRRDLDEVRYYQDISQVIAEVKPDLVDICTQPFLHAPLSVQALEAGINVMCEKPIARSWLETRRLLEAVRKSGKQYQHNENWLYDPDYYTAKKLVDAGAIGEPVLMYLATAHGGPEGAGKFWNSDFGGGGALLDNGIHAVGASWFIAGFDKKPTLVKAAEPFGMSIRMPNRIIDGRYQQVRVDDDAHILIRYENASTGAWTTAHVEGSWSHRDSPETAIVGTTGRIVFRSEEGKSYAVVLDAYDRESRRIQTSGPTWQYWPSTFYGEIQNMVECLRNDVPTISNAEYGAECSAIVGASYLSQRDGKRAVTPDEFKKFALAIADKHSGDDKAANDELVSTLLSAVQREKG